MPSLTLCTMSRKLFSFRENVNRKRSDGNKEPQSRGVSYQRRWLNQTAERLRLSSRASVLGLDFLLLWGIDYAPMWMWPVGAFRDHCIFQFKKMPLRDCKDSTGPPYSRGLLGTYLPVPGTSETPYCLSPNIFALTSKIVFRVNLS